MAKSSEQPEKQVDTAEYIRRTIICNSEYPDHSGELWQDCIEQAAKDSVIS